MKPWHAIKRVMAIATVTALVLLQATPGLASDLSAQSGGATISCTIFVLQASVYETNRIFASQEVECTGAVSTIQLELEVNKWNGASWDVVDSHYPTCSAQTTCTAWTNGTYGSGQFNVTSIGWIWWPPGYTPSPQQIPFQNKFLTVSGGPGSPAR